jgi:hypothetical protein
VAFSFLLKLIAPNGGELASVRLPLAHSANLMLPDVSLFSVGMNKNQTHEKIFRNVATYD